MKYLSTNQSKLLAILQANPGFIVPDEKKVKLPNGTIADRRTLVSLYQCGAIFPNGKLNPHFTYKKMKKDMTADEKVEREKINLINREMGKLSTIVKNNCATTGLQAIQYQRDWLAGHPISTRLACRPSGNQTTIAASNA